MTPEQRTSLTQELIDAADEFVGTSQATCEKIMKALPPDQKLLGKKVICDWLAVAYARAAEDLVRLMHSD